MVDCRDETPECIQARRDYEKAQFDRDRAKDRIKQAKEKLDRALAAAGGGGVGVIGALGALAMASNPAGWVVGALIGAAVVSGLIGGIGGGRAAFANAELDRAREDCENARQKIMDARQRAEGNCQNPECVPPMDTTPCES
jgi:hypothetical protein